MFEVLAITANERFTPARERFTDFKVNVTPSAIVTVCPPVTGVGAGGGVVPTPTSEEYDGLPGPLPLTAWTPTRRYWLVFCAVATYVFDVAPAIFAHEFASAPFEHACHW
jgi:hypothetical protein